MPTHVFAPTQSATKFMNEHISLSETDDEIIWRVAEAIQSVPEHEKPLEALRLVAEHRELMIPEFQMVIDETLEQSRDGVLQELGDWLAPGYATAFLSEWKVPGTHQRLLNILKMKDADREWLIADGLTEDWP